jgi:hypothetical protein
MNFKDDGSTLQGYVDYETKGEAFVMTYKIQVSKDDAAKITKILEEGDLDNRPFHCAHDVSTVLHGIGPFKDLPIDTWPGNLATDVSKLTKDSNRTPGTSQ